MKSRNVEEVVKHIVDQIKDSMDNAVIGLSGGADSTLVACLCKEALGYDNVYGIGMPYNKFDVDNFNSRSFCFASKIGINYHEVPIADISDGIDLAIFTYTDAPVSTGVNKGNSRSRSRMCVLYGFAHSLASQMGDRVRVVGTGNLSEDFIGYDTKGGDALADIFPVGELYKSEIYQLLDYFIKIGVIEDSHVDRVPSAGLEDGQTDEEDLGYSYDEMETSIEYCLENYTSLIKNGISGLLSDVTKFVWARHLANKHKHEAPFVINSRSILKI